MTQTLSESSDSFTLTPPAEAFIRRMLRFSGQGPNAGFRLSVSPGGCSGMSAQFSVEAAPTAGDRTLTKAGLQLFVPPLSYALLQGITVDFKDTPTESGLKFIDPKAGNCACKSVGEPVAVELTPLKT